MSQHNKIKVITKKYTLVFFLIGLSPPAVADQSSYKEKLKLEKIQSRMIDVNKEYAKDKFGMLYVGASKNFNRRFGAYEVKNKNLNELGKK